MLSVGVQAVLAGGAASPVACQFLEAQGSLSKETGVEVRTDTEQLAP